jgi:hypothetical protein
MSYVQTREPMGRNSGARNYGGRLRLGVKRQYTVLECLIMPLAQG